MGILLGKTVWGADNRGQALSKKSTPKKQKTKNKEVYSEDQSHLARLKLQSPINEGA